MPRYYFGENAARPLVAGGQRFAFTITGMAAGAVQGVVAVPDDQHAAFIEVAARFGVQEITPEAYAEALAKKKATPRLPVCVDLRPPRAAGAASSGAGVAASGEAAGPRAEVRPVPSGLPPLRATRSGAPAVMQQGSTERPVEKLPASIDEAVDLGTAVVPVAAPERPAAASRRKRGANK